MNRIGPLLLGLGLLASFAATAQTTHTVNLGITTFSPANLTIEQGDTVNWVNNSNIHNVNGSAASYPGNPEGFTSGPPQNPPWTYSFTFDLAGVYDYHCDVHGAPGFGMRGTIAVTSAAFTVSASGSPGTIPPGGTVTVTVVVSNDTGSAVTVDGWIVVERSGTDVLTQRIGSGTVPDGAAVTRSFPLRAPGNTPPGTYDVTFNVGSFSDAVLASDAFQVTVSGADRSGAPAAEPFVVERVAGDLFAASAASRAPAATARPNPTRGTATLSFALAEASAVRLAVYDLLGREVAVLVDGTLEAGQHEAMLDGSALPAGVYVYRLVVDGQEQTGRLTLVE
jgi:plastocyanin